MRLRTLDDLDETEQRVVIINVHTELVSTLAVLSALRHAPGMRVLLVDCDQTPAGRDHWARLLRRWDFDVVAAPLRPHGIALDHLVPGLRCELFLKLDSDAELRSPTVVDDLVGRFAHPLVFGAGWVEGGWWMGPRERAAPFTAMYHERPWTQCVVFRVPLVRQALEHGVSFEARVIHNDVRWSPALSRLLARRFVDDPHAPAWRPLDRLPAGIKERIRTSRLRRLAWARGDFYGNRPNYVFADMGADVYHWCRYKRAMLFAGLPAKLVADDDVYHYGGVTRLTLSPWQSNGTRLDAITSDVRQRLGEHYDVDWDSLSPLAAALPAH